MRIGILALQGAFAEHAVMLETLGTQSVLVRTSAHLDGLAGLILPGGESTTMRRLAAQNGLDAAMRDFGLCRPIWGVCAGLILLAARVQDETPCLGLMDITVARNAYGRQQDSFISDVTFDGLPGSRAFPGVFIRAPRITEAGGGVRVLARLGDAPVALRQGNLLATAFHPELTADGRAHGYFLDLCARKD